MPEAKPLVVRLTKRAIERLKPRTNGRFIAWDDRLKGFGVRVSSTGKKAFLVQAGPADSNIL